MILLALALFAQIVTPMVPDNMLAYTTADPVDSDRFGLATQDGRYSVRLLEGCTVMPEFQNVRLGFDPNWTLVLETDQWACPVEVIARMDERPCFTNDAGQCDAAVLFDPIP